MYDCHSVERKWYLIIMVGNIVCDGDCTETYMRLNWCKLCIRLSQHGFLINCLGADFVYEYHAIKKKSYMGFSWYRDCIALSWFTRCIGLSWYRSCTGISSTEDC